MARGNATVSTVICLALAFACGPAESQTIPAGRTFVPAWHASGCAGALPNPVGRSVRDFGAVGNGVADDRAAIVATINWVNGQAGVGMVYFPAGTYRFGSTIELPAGIVLRGETDANGNPLATLQHDQGGAWAYSITVTGSRPGAWQPMLPAALHATQVTVTNGSAFSLGDYAEVQQDNDPAWDAGYTWAAHAVGQIVKVVGVQGNVLTLEHGLRAHYEAQYNPQIQRIVPKQGVGIENLKIERIDAVEPAGGSTIHFEAAANCWVRGCELNHCRQRHVEMHYSTKLSITGNYLHHAYSYGGGGSAYGTECTFHTGECRIENNIYVHLRHSMLLQAGPNGNVFGYNYSRDAYWVEIPNNAASDITFHGNRPFGNLFEGNIVCFALLDTSHGQPAGPLNTLFRNATTVVGLYIMPYDPQADMQNIVGNDLLAYSLAGSDHFEHGNRVGAGEGYTVQPPGTDELADRSYYLSTDPLAAVSPAWWTIPSAIPTIGPGATLPFGQANNPAKARWDAGGTLVVGNSGPVMLWGETGSIRVTIEPQAAIDGGARWNVDGGAWQDSGATIGGLAVGLHTVDYKPIGGWTRPDAEQVTVTRDATAATVGTYVRDQHALTVDSEPIRAVAIVGPPSGTTIYTAQVEEGSTVTLTAPMTVQEDTVYYTFLEWHKGSEQMPERDRVLTFVMDTDVQATAVYERTHHTGDYWPSSGIPGPTNRQFDFVIDFHELLRLIQLYNSRALHTDATTEDGYAPGAGAHGWPHSSDYWPASGLPGPGNRAQDWTLDFHELLRAIQLYNSGAYHVDPSTEDGFAPGAQE
jgi:hypothetical protein